VALAILYRLISTDYAARVPDDERSDARLACAGDTVPRRAKGQQSTLRRGRAAPRPR